MVRVCGARSHQRASWRDHARVTHPNHHIWLQYCPHLQASITVQHVKVLDNPSTFLSDFKFEITFECIEPISDGACRCAAASAPLQWRGIKA